MPRNYNEVDIPFYGQEQMTNFEVLPNDYGYLLQWNRTEEAGGYAIYRQPMGNNGWELVVTLDDHITKFQDSKPPVEVAYDYKMYRIIEGDFMLGVPDSSGGVDFGVTVDHESGAQDISNRLRTQKEDWRSHPNLGADLELLEGEPNTKETGNRGEEMIREALTYDARFADEDVEVRAVPTSIEQIDFYTIVDSDDNSPIIVKNPLNL